VSERQTWLLSGRAAMALGYGRRQPVGDALVTLRKASCSGLDNKRMQLTRSAMANGRRGPRS
jgi:hypothetical protein